MRDVTSENFGYLIAYLLPGFVALWGVSSLSPTVQGWLGTIPGESPTVGGFLYVSLGSLGAGLIASTLRWLVVDTLHHHTGIPASKWNITKLQDNVAAFNVLVEGHYRYAQFYGNTFVALIFTWVARRLATGFFASGLHWIDGAYFVLAAILYIGSRDALRKYHERTAELLGSIQAVRRTQRDRQPSKRKQSHSSSASARKSASVTP